MSRKPKDMEAVEPSSQMLMLAEELMALLDKYQKGLSLAEVLAVLAQACGVGVSQAGKDAAGYRRVVIANMDKRAREIEAGIDLPSSTEH